MPNNQVRLPPPINVSCFAHTVQTLNPVDQPFLGSAAQQPSIWDTAGLNPDTGLAISPSTAPTALSLDSASQTSPLTGLTSMSPDLSSRPRQPVQGLPSRQGPPARGHERKRSKLSMDATTPLDSVDYWIDFDKDDGLASIPETMEPVRPQMEAKGKNPLARR